MSRLRFKVHAVTQVDERALTVEDVRMALGNGEDIETRPDDDPYPARLVLGLCRLGVLHVAVRDNIEDDETIVETAYQPDPSIVGAGPHDPQTEPMKCIVCHHGDTHPGVTTVTCHRDGQTVVVNDVPAEVCGNCGEAYVADDVTEQLLAIAAEARKAHAQVLVRAFAPAA